MLAWLQRPLRGAFQRAETGLNALVGDRLNPLYHLGPIAYLLIWVAVGSGLYLYAFFKTSIEGANASVEALTHAQPWAGGILRSVHRYASDAAVVVMLAHMLRHFAFDRYRGLRWFSWVSGVAVMWLVYASGINGYMLPWDRLAKFVTIATAEWLDWLPVFDGTLARNFIVEQNINDRLFSLLSFIHIGVPLALVAFMWVHTQRVPQARTVPPAQVITALALALLALSLLRPALSQNGPETGSLGFDWFYLPAFALLYRWTPGGVWLVVGAGTALLVLAPWLPPLRRERERFALVRPDNRIIAVRPGETLLDAMLRESIAVPFECRNGGCGVCKVSVTSGKVDLGPSLPTALSDAERANGQALACTCTPLSDVEIEYVPASSPSRHEVRIREARVESLERLSPDVMRVMLALEDGPIDFYAGQYINILLEDGVRRSFSFATAPQERERIELHVRLVPGGRFTPRVFDGMKPGERLRFEGPLGSFFLREEGDQPIVFVAGSTGFAPVKSMLEYAFSRGVRRPMLLYWGVRHPEDLYLAALPERWAREHPEFRYVPVVSDPRPDDHWKGRTGLVHEAILEDFPSLAGHKVYACGSAGMVQAAYPAFRARGLAQDDCFSDAFTLAPEGPNPVALTSPDVARLGGGA